VSIVLRTALIRWALFLVFWSALIGVSPAALAVGVVAAGIATWASLQLLPPGPQGVRLGALIALLPRFLWQSLLAGWQVARLAFSPRLRLSPGFVSFRSAYPPGHLRNTFATIASLMPGTLPCGESETEIFFHCLDVEQPVLAELAEEEAAMSGVLGHGAADG
jgi:multicomponent Na+:H+ antiporter subunit E